MFRTLKFAALLPGLLALVACDVENGGNNRINGAVHVAPGAKTGAVSTINGAVEIGAKAAVTDVRSVNGGLSLGEGASAHSVRGSMAHTWWGGCAP